MSLSSKLVALALIVGAILAGVWKLWHTADKAGYERSQHEYQAAAEKQREGNRVTAARAEKKEATRIVYRDRYFATTSKEFENATKNLDSCHLGADVVRMLGDAVICSRSGESAECVSNRRLSDAE